MQYLLQKLCFSVTNISMEKKNSRFKLKPNCENDKTPAKIIKPLPNNILKVLSFIFNISNIQKKYIESFKVTKESASSEKGVSKIIANKQRRKNNWQG